jgi:hypothetical protein
VTVCVNDPEAEVEGGYVGHDLLSLYLDWMSI